MQKGVDFIGVGVGAVIFNNEKKVFLAKRGKGARNERLKWEFPGGSVEFGERIEDAIVREVKEEFNFDVRIELLLDVVNHIIPDEHQHWVSPTFICSYRSGTPCIMEPHKCEQIGWFYLNELPEAELTTASATSLKSLRKFLAKNELKSFFSC